MDSKTELTPEWLDRFREAALIVRTQRDSKGNRYNREFGVMNQACWIGEHAHLLIDEIDRLRQLQSRSSDSEK